MTIRGNMVKKEIDITLQFNLVWAILWSLFPVAITYIVGTPTWFAKYLWIANAIFQFSFGCYRSIKSALKLLDKTYKNNED